MNIHQSLIWECDWREKRSRSGTWNWNKLHEFFVLRITVPFIMWTSQKPQNVHLCSLCHLTPLFHLPTSNYKHLLRNAKIFLLGRTREKFGLESARDIASWQCGRTQHCVVSHHLLFFTYGVSLGHPFIVQRCHRRLIKAPCPLKVITSPPGLVYYTTWLLLNKGYVVKWFQFVFQTYRHKSLFYWLESADHSWPAIKVFQPESLFLL